MATVTITIKDGRNGQVNASVEFDPPYKPGKRKATAAQNLAGVMLQAAHDASDKTEVTDVEGQ